MASQTRPVTAVRTEARLAGGPPLLREVVGSTLGTAHCTSWLGGWDSLAPTLGRACFPPSHSRGPRQACQVQALPHNWTKVSFLCPPLPTGLSPRPPHTSSDPEAGGALGSLPICAHGEQSTARSSAGAGVCSCHVLFPGTRMRSHGPLLVLCPVHCWGC